jgi:hypothetical protein
VSTEQASSVHLPSEQIYELATTQPTLSLPEHFGERGFANGNLPIKMPDHLIILIMESIGSLDDLFNFGLVNKRFYRLFKSRELSLIKNALFEMSPAAWELREMSPPWAMHWQPLFDPDSQVPEYAPALYLDRYARDIYTLAQLKSRILILCTPFLRDDTVKGLSGVDAVRAEEIDDAFWRIWTFCRIFGRGEGRDNDLEGQMDWLKGGVKAGRLNGVSSSLTDPFSMDSVLVEQLEGFARGNGSHGLSARQLYDIIEIWMCLRVLLQPLHGKCLEARKAGIFHDKGVPEGDTTREKSVLGKN